MTEHDPAFRDAQGGGVEHVLRAVQDAIDFLLLAADHDIHVGAVHRRRRVADAELDAADLAVGSPTTRKARAPMRCCSAAASAPSVVSGSVNRCDPGAVRTSRRDRARARCRRR